jgi:hypothetical protein
MADAQPTGYKATAEILFRGLIPILFGTVFHLPGLQIPALAVFTAAILLAWAAKQRSAEDSIDLLLPALIVGVLPFGVGFAVYFVAWHALRHGIWLHSFSTAAGNLQKAAVLQPLQFLPFTVMGTIYLACGVRIATQHGVSPLTFVLASIFAVTIPHELVVALMRREDDLRHAVR